MTVRFSRLAFLPLLASLALVSGCGSKATTSGSSESGATVVGEGALAFVSVSSDLGSSQWQQADKLAQKFSFRDQALAQFKQELAKQNLDYDKDVKPALGPEVDVVVAEGASLNQTVAVLMTKPDDVAKFKALVSKANASGGSTAVYREVNGWYLASDKQASIDKVLKGSGGSLADSSTFKDALGKLPGDALVKAYLNGKQLGPLVREAAAQQGGTALDPSTVGLDKLDYVAASLSAESDGLRARGAAKGAGTNALGAGDYSSSLLGNVPGDALAFLSFRGGGTADQLKKLESNPQTANSLQQLQAMLGVSFDELLALLRNEVGFYLRPGAGIPEFSVALSPSDKTAALSTLDKLAAKVAALTGGKVTAGTVRTINFGQFALHYGAAGDHVLITSGVNGISEFGGSESKLPDNADFKEAKSAAGLPDSNGGFVYLDLKNAIPLIEGFAALGGQSLPPSVAGNLRPLRSFVAWAAGSGDSRTFDAFLEIK
ncbi:MAG: hypothetical protein QOD43_959 [Gaiellaceae bacterium]|nr:hypothetical protein [Gaiellaceae bacterium]